MYKYVYTNDKENIRKLLNSFIDDNLDGKMGFIVVDLNENPKSMKEIILEVLNEFKNTDLNGVNVDELAVRFMDKRNSDFFLREEDYDFFVNAEASFCIDGKENLLKMSFRVYNKDGNVITSMSEDYNHIDWYSLQDSSDKELEEIADYWVSSIEKSKERVIKHYTNLYNSIVKDKK